MILRIIKFFFKSLKDICKFFVIYMPGTFGVKIRHLYYKYKFKSCGKNVIIDLGVIIDGAEHISVGDNVRIDKYCIISTGNKLIGKITRRKNHDFNENEGEVFIGNNIHICQSCILMGYGGVKINDNFVMSAGSKIYSLTNTAYDLEDRTKIIKLMPYTQAPFLCSPVVIGENVWLGLNTIIMPNVTIGSNSFLASNSLLMDKIEKNSYVCGQPAKKIRNRFDLKN